MLETFRWLGEETAARFGYTYPLESHERIVILVAGSFAATSS